MDRSKGKPARASMWYVICSVAQKGISMVLIPLYVRLMTTEQYGIYTLFQSWAGIVLMCATLNLAAYAFNNCLIRNEEKKDWVTGVFLGLLSALTIIVCAVFLLFLEHWEKLFGFSGKYVIALALDSFFVVAIDLWYARKKFDYEYRGIVLITLIIAIANLITGAVCVSLSEDKAFAAIAAKLGVQGVIVFILAISIWRKGKACYDREMWKYVLCFSIPLIPHFLSTKILQQADRIMIQKYSGTANAGIYGFSYKISEVMLLFHGALLSSIIPLTYRKMKEKKYSDISEPIMLTVILMGVLNLFLILFAPEAMAILGTEEYQGAVYVIPPLACSCYLMYLSDVFVNVTYYFGRNKLVVAATVVAAAVNVGLNYIFIPKYGYLAAGFTTLASYALLTVLHYGMYKYTIRMKKIQTSMLSGSRIAVLSVGIVLLGSSIAWLYGHRIVRYGVILLLGAGIVIYRTKIRNAIREIRK